VRRQRNRLSDLQTLVIRLSFHKHQCDPEGVDVYYCEVLAKYGWTEKQIQSTPIAYREALKRLDCECRKLEQLGYLERTISLSNAERGVRLTDSGQRAADELVQRIEQERRALRSQREEEQPTILSRARPPFARLLAAIRGKGRQT
jgi:hypothetical protein